MKIHTFAQWSPEWEAIHHGKFSGRDFDTLMPGPRQKEQWNKTQKKIIHRVASQRLSEVVATSSYVSQSIQWGIDTEPAARFAYELEMGTVVDQIGFAEFSEWIGCSPDGLVGTDGVTEFKCPDSATLIGYIDDPSSFLDEYYWQCVGGILCTERKWCDLYGYDPRLREDRQSLRIRIERNDDCDKLLARLNDAVAEVKRIIGERSST